MIAPISSLSNMEMQLYGGLGYNTNVPSYTNGYLGSSGIVNQYSNPQFYGYNNYQNYYNNPSYYNSISNQNSPTNYSNYASQASTTNTSSQTAQPKTIFQGLTQKEQKALVNTYRKGLEPAEELALGSGIAMQSIMMNPRLIAHPYNTIKTFFGLKGANDTNEMFKAAKGNGKLAKLWKENAYIMEEAFAQMNRTEARSLGKLGWIRKQYSPKEYKQLKDIMEKALKSGEIDEIAKATEILRHAQVNNGKIPSFFKGDKTATVASRIADNATIAENTKKFLQESKDMTFGKAWNRVGGKWGLAFGGLEILGSIDKISTAFKEDTTTGFMQLGQSVVKAGASAIGWQAGEALGVLGATKITPMITKRFGGKWGTIIGAIARPACALASYWVSKNIAKGIVGEDVANKIQARNTAQTNEGQQQILQNIVERMQSGEKIDLQTQQALQKLMTMYA